MPVRAFARKEAAARWARRQRRRKNVCNARWGRAAFARICATAVSSPVPHRQHAFCPPALPHAPACAPGTAARTARWRTAAIGGRAHGRRREMARAPFACAHIETADCSREPAGPTARKGPLFAPDAPSPWAGAHVDGTVGQARNGAITARPAGAAARARPASRYARGRRMMKSLPAPTSLCTSISPCMAMTMCLTIARPSPVPPMARERPLSTR